ncbi:MAG: RNA methyltransferase [Treponemataceae bacterium]|nr:RNA methyltransferase [Treponemataceae bacterium]
MTLDDICIVLTHPEESRNIGSACRAMANMGIKKLRIVGKREDYKDRQIRILAIHAAYIWDNAEFFDSITQATSDCVISAGTTRRRGKKRKEWLVTPEEFVSNGAFTEQGNIAVVFGNERTGLTDEELEECTMGIQIPSSPEFPSLNLSHAVQIMCYTLYRKLETPNFTGYTPISLERLDKTVTIIADNLQKIGFFSVTGRPEMENFWKGILSRSALSEGEAAYLEKIFTKASGLASKKVSS